MIPFYPPPVFHVFGLTFYGFGLCVAAAILVGSYMVQRRVGKLGLDVDIVTDLLYSLFIGGFVVAHLVDVFIYRPAALKEDPLLIFKVWNGISSYGGFFGSLAGIAFFLKRRKTPRAEFWGYCESIIYSLPFGWVFGRLGCFLAHDHPGVKADVFFAIQAPPPQWQQAMQLPDGPFLDLGFLEMLYTMCIVGVLLLLDRKRRPVGFYLAVVPLIYAPIRFTLDFFRIRDVTYLGLTPGQYASLSLLALSGWLWSRRPRGVYGYGPDGPTGVEGEPLGS